MHEARRCRKSILKTRDRNLRVKVALKIFTLARFQEVHKKTAEAAGFTPAWHVTPDGPIWGVKARALPEGEYDAEDEQVDGVMEEEIVDSGEEEVRAGQGEVKFQALSSREAGAKSAIFLAVSLAGGGGGADRCTDDGGGATDGSSSESEACAPVCRPLGLGPVRST